MPLGETPNARSHIGLEPVGAGLLAKAVGQLRRYRPR
jgi:hypothetical protein